MIKSLLARMRRSAFKICCFGRFAFLLAGTVAVQPVAAQGYTVLHTFVPAEGIGYNPGQVLQGADGMLYGIAWGEPGNLFRMNPDGSNPVALYSFNGYVPSGLIQGRDGRLYGTTGLGAAGDGYVYGVNTDGSNFVILHSFGGYADGAGPFGLIQGADGRLYGSTDEGGPFNVVGGNIGCGTIYTLNVDGSGFTILHYFDSPTGANPTTALTQASDGRLYGVTQTGGTADLGVAYGLNTDGTGFAVLHSFANAGDGSVPLAPLVQGFDGKLYGSSLNQGIKSANVFSINTDGTGFTVLTQIANTEYIAQLVMGRNNVIYGATFNVGPYPANYGILFQMNLDGTNYQVGHIFYGNPDGGEAVSLFQGNDGRYYGTTLLGGGVPTGEGIVFAYDAPATPVITSGATASGAVGSPFTYSIAASAAPIVAYATAYLPAGLAVNPETGVISGVPSQPGTFFALVAGANAYGLGVALLTITIN